MLDVGVICHHIVSEQVSTRLNVLICKKDHTLEGHCNNETTTDRGRSVIIGYLWQ